MDDTKHRDRPMTCVWHIVEACDPPPEFSLDEKHGVFEAYSLEGSHRYVGASRPVIATANDLRGLVERILEIGIACEKAHARSTADSATDVRRVES
ncbi:hypothetical protein [Pandoraea soli]|nr:hypothetical protein [Pandoraea soli]